MRDSPVLRIALYSHVHVRGDAISGSYDLKLRLLSDLRRQGAPLEIIAYCCDTDYPGANVRRVAGVADLLLQPEFWQADLHCYEFGIHSELLDSVMVVPASAARLTFYHNITPPELVAPYLRSLMEKSLLQRFNLFMMHHVACISEINRQDLLSIGIPADRLSVVPLPAPCGPPKLCFAHRHTTLPLVQVLFVGRFVQAKGVRELIDALCGLAKEKLHFEANVVFNSKFSDQELVRKLRLQIARNGLGPYVHFLPDAPDQALTSLYERADCLVLPSYHEGFGVPVLEALSAGCFVIATDVGNLPFILGGLGQLVPKGDSTALGNALRDFIREIHIAREERREPLLPTANGPMSASDWCEALGPHLSAFSSGAFQTGFGAALRRAIAGSGRLVPSWLDERRFAALARSATA